MTSTPTPTSTRPSTRTDSRADAAGSQPSRARELAVELAAQGVRYGAISFVDLHGKPKAKMVPLAHLDHAAHGSELFTGAALDGVPQDVSDEEVSAIPDLSCPYVLPSHPDVAFFPSSLHYQGQPFEACSRGILQRVTAQAATAGYTFQLGIETEFFLLRRDERGSLVPLAAADDLAKPCYDLRGMLRNFTLVDEIVTAMNDLGWDVYSFDHEDANGQFETDFAYTDAVTMADRLTFFRLMVGELAHARGAIATFMPKPVAGQTGSGGHMNMSLADAEGLNLFEDDGSADPYGLGLSALGYRFVAGVLAHAPAICAVVAPTVNSYKRLIRRSNASGFTWAPIFASFGGNNRTNMLRIPLGGGRIECRAADSSTNPYLAAALMLAAGLEGIAGGADPGPPHQENMYTLSQAELDEAGVRALPASLGEAVAAFADDALAADVFGPAMHAAFVAEKTAEWESYCAHVSDWETARYLEFF